MPSSGPPGYVGLTDHESQLLETLVHIGSSSRALLSERAGVPLPEVKRILNRLELLGYAVADAAGNWTPLAKPAW